MQGIGKIRIKGQLYCCMGLVIVHVGFRTGFELKVVERRVAIDISEKTQTKNF